MGVYATIRVEEEYKSGFSRVLMKDYMIEVDKESTFLDCFKGLVRSSALGSSLFLHSLESPSPKDELSCSISPEKEKGNIRVSPSLKMTKAMQDYDCRFVAFKISRGDSSYEVSDAGAGKNVFSIMMQSTRKQEVKYLPLKYENPKRGDWILYNDLVDLIEKEGAYFNHSSQELVARRFVHQLCDCLYAVLPHLNKFKGRGHNLPAVFLKHLKVNKKDLSQSYNNPTNHKHRIPNLSSESLKEHADSLFCLLTEPFMKMDRFSSVRSGVTELAQTVVKYAQYLDKVNEDMKKTHNAIEPCRNVHDGSSTSFESRHGNFVRSQIIIDRYKSLELELMLKAFYEPVLVNDFAPQNRHKRYAFVHEISLPFSTENYSYSAGNYVGATHFIWRTPPCPDFHTSKQVMETIEKNIPVYHTRIMRKEFQSRFTGLVKVQPVVLQEMYRYLTGDSTAVINDISKEVRARLDLLLQSGDIDGVYDLRDLNRGRPVKYDSFFDGVQNYINKMALEAVDERRHGDCTHMALAISTRDLIEQVSKDLPEGTEVPNENYLRLQFWPKNPYFKSAVHYTGRFNVKYMVQSRQLRSNHVDSHYAAAVFRYLREFSVKFREMCTFLSLDDKHQIKVGEPGYPVAAVDRGRQVLVAKDKPFTVGDHDFTKFKVTPSVALKVTIPETVDNTFYNGHVYVTLKNTILQPSSPMRHMAEISGIVAEQANPILVVYSDGGGDHRVTFLSVQLGLLALFVKHKLTFVVAARCAPCQSYMDPVERVMSLLNLGLQSVGAMRQEMPKGFEKQIHGLNTIADIRKKALNDDELKNELGESLTPVIDLLGCTLGRLNWKGNKLHIMEAASDSQISSLVDILKELDPAFEVDKTQQKHLRNYPVLQKFLDTHSYRSHYMYCLKRCTLAECPVCSISIDTRVPSDLLEKLHYLPLPVPDEGARIDHYKPFSELWGSTPTEKFRPSLGRQLDADELDKLPFTASGENCRGFVNCEVCNKPRCFYSRKKLTSEQHEEIRKQSEDIEYTCGAQLFYTDPRLVYMEIRITCESHVSSHYFHKRQVNPLVCYICGDPDPIEVPCEIITSHSSAHPTCEDCKSKGFQPRVRRKMLLGKRKM